MLKLVNNENKEVKQITANNNGNQSCWGNDADTCWVFTDFCGHDDTSDCWGGDYCFWDDTSGCGSPINWSGDWCADNDTD